MVFDGSLRGDIDAWSSSTTIALFVLDGAVAPDELVGTFRRRTSLWCLRRAVVTLANGAVSPIGFARRMFRARPTARPR